MPPVSDRTFLFFVLLLAALLRLYGIDHGLPQVYNPDEANIMARALSVARSPDPGYYLLPNFYFYFLFAVMGGLFVVGRMIGRYPSLSVFEARFFEDPTDFYLTGRIVVVLFALATIVLIERLVTKHLGKVAGRGAAFVVAVSYVHARDSHYVKHDVPAAFLMLVFLWAADRALTRKTLSSYLLAGAILGAGVATQYYLVFLAPAFVVCQLAYRGREGFLQLVAAGAASLTTFFLLSPFVLLRFGTALEHMRANRQVVLDRSLSSGSSLFPSLGRYVDFLLEQGLGYALSALVLVGFLLMARRGTRTLALWASFPLLFLAFLSYTFFAGRYLNPILPALAAAAGLSISAIADRFGSAAAVVVAALSALQPLYFAVHVDRLFGREDTRTVARAWALEHLAAGTTVALQSYSVPLPQSEESFLESLRRNHAEAELARKGKYAHLLRVAGNEGKTFRLVYLGKGDELDRTYVGYEALVPGLEPLRKLGVESIVLRHPPISPPPDVEALFRRVQSEGKLLERVSPFDGESAGPPYLDNEDWPPSGELQRKGPLVEIWSLEGR